MKNRQMKRSILVGVAALALSCAAAYAQNVRVGARAGVNLPNITAGGKNTPVSEGYSSRAASGMGIFTELELTGKWSLRFGVEYSGQGGKKNGMQAMPTERLVTGVATGMGMSVPQDAITALQGVAASSPYYYADIKNTVKFAYVMIPILAQYNIPLGEKWQLYVNAGPFVSFFVSGKQVSKGKSLMYADAAGSKTLWNALDAKTQAAVTQHVPALSATLQQPTDFGSTNITGEMKSTNFGLIGNVGIRYHYQRSAFFLEAGGNYGFITVQQKDANGSNRLGAASVMLGYSFSLWN
jgi:hypothetical protein